MTAMIRCYQCGTDNLDGSEYCDECGKKLASVAAPAQSSYAPPSLQSTLAVQPAPPPPPSFIQQTMTPKPATPYTPPPPAHPPAPPASVPINQPTSSPKLAQSVQQVVNQMPPPPPVITNLVSSQSSTATYSGTGESMAGANYNVNNGPPQQVMSSQPVGGSVSTTRAKLIIQRGGQVGKEFPIANAESLIGRWDADGGIFPDVDLDQDDPEAKVSRRHARIQLLNNQYLIEDLGSTNGTFINRGPRLLPNNKQPLNNGDEIIVGKTFLKFVLS